MPFEEILYCPECYRRYSAGHGYCPEHGARLVLIPPEDSLVGQTVAGRYRVEEEIGGGGTGLAFRAVHTGIDRRITLKVFRRFLADDETAATRFDADADGALQLKGRYTVQIYDSGRTEDGRLFLARDYVDGPSLRDLIATHGRLAPARALRAALGVARALEYAHARGVLHRGLSPSNIFLVDEDGEEVARVTDFDQAGALTGTDRISLTPAGIALLPLRYISPEQAVGASCDVAADLYSLGLVLFEALTGQPAFDADGPLELLLAQAQSPPQRPSEVAADAEIPQRVEDLVLRLLVKQPKQRPPSASVLASELEVLLKAIPVKAAAAAAHRSVNAPPAAATVAPTPPTAPSAPSRDQAQRAKEATEAPPETTDTGWELAPDAHRRRSKAPLFIGGALVLLALIVTALFASGIISERSQEPAGEEIAAVVDVVDNAASPDVAPSVAPDIIPAVTPDVVPDVTPEMAPDIVSEVIPEVIPHTTSVVRPNVAPKARLDIAPKIDPKLGLAIVPHSTEVLVPPEVEEEPPKHDKRLPRHEKSPSKEEVKPPPKEEVKPPPKEEVKPPPKEEVKPPPKEEKKPDPVIAKPMGMDDSDFALAKEQVSWGRKNMKKQLWEMAILNFQQAQRMGLTDPSISRYIRECRNHMAIVADALERGHAAFLASQWDEAIRQFQRARNHGEKNTTTFRMIEKSKEAKAKEEADKAE